MAAKATQRSFPLSTVAGRVALLCGITAGTVTRKEVEAAVVQDTTPRQRKKPVVAYGFRFNSVTEAAKWNLKYCNKNGPEYALALDRCKHRIAYLCNKDQTVGFYWSE